MMLSLDLPTWLQLAIAGGFGGVIRWLSTKSHWQAGLSDVVAGAIGGFFLAGLVFALLRPLADLSVIQAADAQLLGAHIAGVVGVNIYTIPTDILKGWKPKEPQP